MTAITLRATPIWSKEAMKKVHPSTEHDTESWVLSLEGAEIASGKSLSELVTEVYPTMMSLAKAKSAEVGGACELRISSNVDIGFAKPSIERGE
jgi:hypothetical protein